MTKSCTTHKVHKSCGNMKILCVPVDGAANLKNKHCVLCSVFCAAAVSPGSRFYLRVNKCSDDEHNICVRCYGEGVKRSNIEHNAATIITCLSDHLADNTAPSVRQSAKYSQSSLANWADVSHALWNVSHLTKSICQYNIAGMLCLGGGSRTFSISLV